MSKRIPEPDPPAYPERGYAEAAGDADLQEYAGSRDPSLRDRLVLRYTPLVSRIAAHTAARLPAHMEQADLVSAGTLGLFEALDRFEPGRGHAFESYAVTRIRGAMLDEVRASQVVPRSYWSRRREVDRVAAALGSALGRQPAAAEVSAATGLAESEVSRLAAGHEPGPPPDELSIDEAARFSCLATSGDPEQAAVDADVRHRLRLAVDRLPDRIYRIIDWYYRGGLTFAQIAERLGVTESRVAQLHARALADLRQRLGAR